MLKQSFILYCVGKFDAFLGLKYYSKTLAYQKIAVFEVDSRNITLELVEMREDNFIVYVVGTEFNILFATTEYRLAEKVFAERKHYINELKRKENLWIQ